MSRKLSIVILGLLAMMPAAEQVGAQEPMKETAQEAAQEKELLDYPLDTINGEEVYRYEVERSVGLYRVGVNFNV